MNNIEKILTDWSLSEYIATFRENKIDTSTLHLLDREMVGELIKPIGDRVKFLRNLEIWKKFADDNMLTRNICIPQQMDNVVEIKPKEEINFDGIEDNNADPLDLPSTTCVGRDLSPANISVSSPTSSCTQELKPLLEILNDSSEGRNIMKLHRDEGLLLSNSRRKLCNIIIHHLLGDDMTVRISHSTLHYYAHEIRNVFTKENASLYFVPYTNNKKMKIRACAKGKLYDCLHNRKRDYRQAAKKQAEVKQKHAQQNEDDEELKEEIQLNIQWLKTSTEPWELVETKWQDTTSARYKQLNTNEKTVAQYMQQFPCLQKPTGFQLLLMDFKNLHPGKENLLYDNFYDIQDKIISYAQQRAERDSTLKAVTQVLETLSDTDVLRATEVKTLIALLTLPLLLKNPKTKSKRDSWRPSKQEASESFITPIETPTDIHSTIERRREMFKKINVTLQPFILVVGRDYLNIECYYVVIHDSFYLLHSILDAVDVCYKSFHVLNSRYPEECVSTWQFIQKGLYRMQTLWDTNFVTVNSFLADIGIQID